MVETVLGRNPLGVDGSEAVNADEEVLVLAEELFGETDSCLLFQFDSQFLQSWFKRF